jgi:D-glucosaminate-6-phosphate ammonia-lyase
MSNIDLHDALGLRRVINASGTMTGLGASIIVPEAIAAMTQIMPQFVEIDELQKRAGAVIARLTGAEAGFITASCSAAVTISIAGLMTGDDLYAVERLPDTAGMKNEVVISTGHLVGYGAPVDQAIRLSGAKVVSVGQATELRPYQLEGAINEHTAAAVYVISHHAAHYGMLPLSEFIAICHARGVPVIVDAASEYDLTGLISAGADIALYSAHKFWGGPTGGIIAGAKQMVRSAYLQNGGIGRGMKCGKETIFGAMAALEAWEKRDHAAVRAREKQTLTLWQDALAGRVGVVTEISPDPTGSPLDRLLVRIDPQTAGITAWDFVDVMARGNPPIILRDHEVELGYFYLDPCNLHPGQDAIVAERLVSEFEGAWQSNTVIATPFAGRLRRREAYLKRWPDEMG